MIDATKVSVWLNTMADHMENNRLKLAMKEAARLIMFQKNTIDQVTKANGTMAEKLAEHMNAEQAGRLLKLPCAIGDKVYVINWCDEMADGERCPCQCSGTQIDHVFNPDCIKYCGICECSFCLEMLYGIGDTVFLTREEAMKKLEDKANARCSAVE